jgi:IS4 transposase
MTRRVPGRVALATAGGQGAGNRQGGILRRIVVEVPDGEHPLVLLTNHLGLGPTTVARLHRERWRVEVFFRALKQNLRIKTFVGTRANALKIQIRTALIAMLLLK